MECMKCDKPATLVNHTQFAGTHYWCDAHVPAEDRDECTPLNSLQNRWETRAAKVLHETFGPTNPEYETAPLTSQPPNPYTNDRVQYLLDKLQEEAAEVIQAVSKIRRFGPHNHHPDRTTTNLQELTGELEDFQAIIWALEELQYFDPKPSTIATIRKFNTIMGS